MILATEKCPPPHYIHNFWNLDYYLIWQKMGAGDYVRWEVMLDYMGRPYPSRGQFDAEEKTEQRYFRMLALKMREIWPQTRMPTATRS